MKKIVERIYIYKVLPPYKNWYSIMTDDGLNLNNIIVVGKKQLLKVALALIVMVLFNKRTTINKFKTIKKGIKYGKKHQRSCWFYHLQSKDN